MFEERDTLMLVDQSKIRLSLSNDENFEFCVAAFSKSQGFVYHSCAFMPYVIFNVQTRVGSKVGDLYV